MSNSGNEGPSIEDQISEFQGLSVEDGKVTSVQNGARLSEAEGGGQEGQEGQEGEGEPRGDGVPLPDNLTPTQRQQQRRASAQDRIDQAVKRQREAERSADDLRRRLEALEARSAPATPPLTNQPAQGQNSANNAPDPSQYQFGELDGRYISDLARYSAQQAFEEQSRVAQEQARAANEQHRARELVTEAQKKYPDFVETVIQSAQRNEWPLSRTITELSMESQAGADILYHMATAPDVANSVAQLTPAKQAAWFGRVEAHFLGMSQTATGQRAPERETQAPPPPQYRARGNSQPQEPSPDTTDFAAFERMAMNSMNGGRR